MLFFTYFGDKHIFLSFLNKYQPPHEKTVLSLSQAKAQIAQASLIKVHLENQTEVISSERDFVLVGKFAEEILSAL